MIRSVEKGSSTDKGKKKEKRSQKLRMTRFLSLGRISLPFDTLGNEKEKKIVLIWRKFLNSLWKFDFLSWIMGCASNGVHWCVLASVCMHRIQFLSEKASKLMIFCGFQWIFRVKKWVLLRKRFRQGFWHFFCFKRLKNRLFNSFPIKLHQYLAKMPENTWICTKNKLKLLKMIKICHFHLFLSEKLQNPVQKRYFSQEPFSWRDQSCKTVMCLWKDYGGHPNGNFRNTKFSKKKKQPYFSGFRCETQV